MDRNTVLVVDDSRAIRAVLAHALQGEAGLRVLQAGNMAGAITLLESTDPESVLAVIVDLNLPDAPAGELLDWVITHCELPVIVLTGSFSGELTERVRRAGVLDLVMKRNPLEMEKLVALVSRLYQNASRKVLVVDDAPSSLRFMSVLLGHLNICPVLAGSAADALQKIEAGLLPELVITDYNMPGMGGDELVAELRARFGRNEVAVLGVSSVDAPETAVKLLKAGANDFLNRPFLEEEFYCRVNNAIETVTSYRRLREASLRDFLTGLNNRMCLYQVGEPAWSEAEKTGDSLVVAMMDIDHFKAVNDTHGHHVGDLALKHVSRILERQLEGEIALCRVGGEEFCAVWRGSGLSQCVEQLERMRSHLEAAPLCVDDLELGLTLSIGVTATLSESFQRMVGLADEALYKAKNAGRNRVVSA